MRILLIQSYLGRREPLVAPLGLAVLAANLPSGELKIFDPNILSNPLSYTSTLISDYKPNIIGLSLRNIDTAEYNDVFLYYRHFRDYVNLIKDIAPNTILAVGGNGFSLFPLKIMEDNPAIDFGFFLESDVAFKKFIENGLNPETIPGIYFRKDNKVKFTGKNDPVQVHTIRKPRWDLIDLKPYLNFQHLSSIGIESKRGCSQKCVYCTYPKLNTSAIRAKDPKDVVEEITDLYSSHNVKQVFFTDSVFNSPLEHAEAICCALIDSGLQVKWSAYHHPSYISEKYIELAQQSGCVDFYFSPDAATNRGMKILGKSSTTSDLKRCLDIIEQNGKAKASYNFFAAFPGSGWDDYFSAKRFIIKAKERLGNRLTRYKISFIRIQPQTTLWYKVFGKNIADDALLPYNEKELQRLFYKKSDSFFLNLLLLCKFYWGIIFGKKNIVKTRPGIE